MTSKLTRSPSVLHFPTISPRESCLLKEEEFLPVMPTRRYNLLKLHELKHHRDRDRRLGRLSYEKDRLIKIAEI